MRPLTNAVNTAYVSFLLILLSATPFPAPAQFDIPMAGHLDREISEATVESTLARAKPIWLGEPHRSNRWAQGSLAPAEGSILSFAGSWDWGTCKAVGIVQDHHVLVGNGRLLQVYDVASPAFPQLISETKCTYPIQWMAVQGNLAYVAPPFQVINLSNPASPQILSSLPLRYGCTRLLVQGDYAFAGDQAGLVWVIDVHDPTAPKILSALIASSDFVTAMHLAEPYLYVTTNHLGMLDIFDVSDRANPREVKDYWIGLPGIALAWRDSALWLGLEGRLRCYDLRNPLEPLLLGILKLDDAPITITLQDTLAYVTLSEREVLSIASIRDKTNPFEVGRIGSGRYQVGPGPLSLQQGFAYMGALTGMWIVDVRDVHALKTATIVPAASRVTRVELQYPYAFVGASYAGMKVVDLSDPARMVTVCHWPTPAMALNVAVSGSTACVVSGTETSKEVEVLDISVPFAPRCVGRLSLDDTVYVAGSLYLQPSAFIGDYWVTSFGSKKLYMIDIHIRASPTSLSSRELSYPGQSLVAVGNYVLAAAGTAGLLVFSVEDPREFKLVDSINVGYTTALETDNSLAYMSAGAGLWVLDMSNPAHPNLVGSVPTSGSRTYVKLAHKYPFVYMEYTDRMYVIDVSNSRAPTIVDSLVGPLVNWVDTYKDLVVLADWDLGLAAYRNSHFSSDPWSAPPSSRLLRLEQNYPNPFNSITAIEYVLTKDAFVRLEVFDLLGRKVTTLTEGEKLAGRHRVPFSGASLASGVYIYRIEIDGLHQAKRALLVR